MVHRPVGSVSASPDDQEDSSRNMFSSCTGPCVTGLGGLGLKIGCRSGSRWFVLCIISPQAAYLLGRWPARGFCRLPFCMYVLNNMFNFVSITLFSFATTDLNKMKFFSDRWYWEWRMKRAGLCRQGRGRRQSTTAQGDLALLGEPCLVVQCREGRMYLFQGNRSKADRVSTLLHSDHLGLACLVSAGLVLFRSTGCVPWTG